MTERLSAIDEEQTKREQVKLLLEDFKPRSSETHDERMRPEDIDKMVAAIEADPDLTDEERVTLLEEVINKYDRTAKLPVYAHMGI